MSGRYECRIVASFAEEIVSTPKNYSITCEWCGMSEKTKGSAKNGNCKEFRQFRHGYRYVGLDRDNKVEKNPIVRKASSGKRNVVKFADTHVEGQKADTAGRSVEEF
jgi:hypothetical protein